VGRDDGDDGPLRVRHERVLVVAAVDRGVVDGVVVEVVGPAHDAIVADELVQRGVARQRVVLQEVLGGLLEDGLVVCLVACAGFDQWERVVSVHRKLKALRHGSGPLLLACA